MKEHHPSHFTHPLNVRVKRVPGPIAKDISYWAFMMGALALLFVFYITGKGELKSWLNVLIWNPGLAPQASGAGQAPGGIGNPAPVQTKEGPVAAGGAAIGAGSATPPGTYIVPGGKSLLDYPGGYGGVKTVLGQGFAPPRGLPGGK